MTVGRAAFYFGWLELGFVLLVAGFLPSSVFVVFSGLPCVLLMREGSGVGWARRRPKTVAREGDSL